MVAVANAIKIHNRPENAFGYFLPTIASVARDRRMADVIVATLRGVLSDLGASGPELLAEEILKIAESSDCDARYEKVAHNFLKRKGALSMIPQRLAGRAQLIYDQISNLISGNSILDLGCGDGKVGKLFAQAGKCVSLCDVYRNLNLEKVGLPFKIYSQNAPLPFSDSSFDTALVLTVFHHSDDPEAVLREVVRVLHTGGRLIVIESVFGINHLPAETPRIPANERYCNLTEEEQRISNIFFDHFYNRIVHFSEDPNKKINVPYNFNTPENWQSLFDNNGLRQISVTHLGIDQSIVPEYHTLHVCDKIAL